MRAFVLLYDDAGEPQCQLYADRHALEEDFPTLTWDDSAGDGDVCAHDLGGGDVLLVRRFTLEAYQ
jgi:hypothetical protein